MRKLIPNIVNEDFIPTIENIDRLACDILCHLPLPYCETELVQATIDCKKSGHKPHRDFKNSQPDLGKSTNKYTPNPRYKNCIMACSVLLTDPSSYKGGSFHFYNHEECIREEHYLSALVYDTDQVHSVDPHSDGDRWVLLMFFASEECKSGCLYVLNEGKYVP